MNQKTLAIFLFLGACSELRASEPLLFYAAKQGLAQGALLLKARKITDLLRDPVVPEKTKDSLRLSQEILSFAKDLPMKTGASYTRFVEVEHDWITQVIVAAHKDRLEIKPFDFPIVGAFPYKGYFSEADAQKQEELLSEKYDVFRRKVPAYSSLGWFSDPLTSNLIRDEYFLIETLFHELVHLNFYFEEHSDFNEAFATWFSYKATSEFIEESKNINNKDSLKQKLAESLEYDKEINAFIEEIRKQGEFFYKTKDSAQKRENYFSWISDCAKRYTALKNFEKIKWNNAVVMAFSTYTRLIPAIESYAQKNNLNYKSFLKKISDLGPSVAKEIEASSAVEFAKRCAPIIP